MKKPHLIALCYTLITLLLFSLVFDIHLNNPNLNASTFTAEDRLTELEKHATHLDTQLNTLEDRIVTLEKQNALLEDLLVTYYIQKLKDPSYTSIYNHEYTYYIAAESLGQIGAPAIPQLISRLTTTDDYERALVLYALCLASQADNAKVICGSDYFQANLDFDARNHPEVVKSAFAWWDKYKDLF